MSVALALSIPSFFPHSGAVPEREIVLSVTYVVVVISIALQGLTIEPLLRRIIPRVSAEEADVAREVASESPHAAA